MGNKEFILSKVEYEVAIEYVTMKHSGQYRAFTPTTPYVTHPIRVASMIQKFKKSHEIDSLTLAALGHDLFEDTNTTEAEVLKIFGPIALGLIKELTSDNNEILRLGQIEYSKLYPNQICNLRVIKRLGKIEYLKIKMTNMSSWALVIKLCDRLDNIMDSPIASDKFRINYCKETRAIIDHIKISRVLSDTHKYIINLIEMHLDIYENLK
jgi:(p)ppGpp synthase/HD superfamily hydrolase